MRECVLCCTLGGRREEALVVAALARCVWINQVRSLSPRTLLFFAVVAYSLLCVFAHNAPTARTLVAVWLNVFHLSLR